MKKHARKAFNALEKIGAPVFQRSDVEYFVISAEDNDDTVWADYYMEFGINRDNSTPGVDQRVCDILDQYGLYAEWENPGCLGVYDA